MKLKQDLLVKLFDTFIEEREKSKSKFGRGNLPRLVVEDSENDKIEKGFAVKESSPKDDDASSVN